MATSLNSQGVTARAVAVGGVQRVGVEMIRGWCRGCGERVTNAVLRRVDEAYSDRFGCRPIVCEVSSE